MVSISERKRLIMGKKVYISVFVIALSVFVFNPYVSARDTRSITPVLSEDSISSTSAQFNKETPIYLAQNTPATPEDDVSKTDDISEPVDEDFEEPLFDDYDDTKVIQTVADPLYYFNYAMYTFNDFLYFAAIKPIATGYKAIMPSVIRKGVNNFFHNLLFPVRFINNFLQGEMKDAGTEIEIFLINSTIGVLGFGQIAQNNFDLHTSNEDLGLTLGTYSIGNGFYLVLPILGPSTFRDTIGLAGDYFVTPVNYAEPWELLWGLKVYDSLNAASFRLGDYEALKQAAIDPYVALRDAYIQYRKEKLRE